MLGFIIKQMKENEELHILSSNGETYWLPSGIKDDMDPFIAQCSGFYLLNSYTVLLELFS